MNFLQNICFPDDKEYTIGVVSTEVNVNCCAGTHNHGSSKVKLSNVVDYNWELKFHPGQLLAVHLNGSIIAYAIKTKKSGMVRIANLQTGTRALIKEVSGFIQDISFALIPQQIILGVVDEQGNLLVYSIDDRSDSLICNLLLNVIHPLSQATNYRLVWCPYIPSFGENSDTLDDPAKLLLLLNGTKVEVWDVSVINSQYGTQPLCPRKGYEGFVEIDEHDLDVVDASFSPDGTAIATAGMDGYVKFFQVYIVENDEPKCLHQWSPHGGKALSSLFFLDNVQIYGPESKFWKFAITGSSFNTELKLWSCETWYCLQTIRFTPNPKSQSPDLVMKVHLDITGQYLLLSDIFNRILYILKLDKNDSEHIAKISSVSEFLLPAPFLSFCIRSVESCKVQYSGSSEDLNLCEGEDDEENNDMNAVEIKMHVMQPKKLQDCIITFSLPENCAPPKTNSFGIEPASDTLINLTEIPSTDEQEAEPDGREVSKLSDLKSSVNYLIQQQSNQAPLNLMTPDAFTSPIHSSSSPNSIKNRSLNDIKITPSISETKEDDNVKEMLLDAAAILQREDNMHKDNFASAGSSPSREVQEILSFKNTRDEYYENMKQIELTNKVEKQNSEVESQNNYGHTVDDLLTNEKSGDIIWPDIPIIKANELLKEEKRKLNEVNGGDSFDNDQIRQLSMRLQCIEDSLREQTSLMQNLHRDFKNIASGIKTELRDDMRNTYTKEMEILLSNSGLQQAQYIENCLNAHKKLDREHYEKLMSNSTLSLPKQITDKLQTMITNEMKNSLTPTIMSGFENLKHQLFVDYSQKLNSTDQLLKENISKLATNKAVIDSLGASIVSIIKPSLETCYKDIVAKTLIPSWERICTTMFKQIHDTFLQGTKEYTTSVQGFMDRQRCVQEKGADLIIQMCTTSDSIKKNLENVGISVAEEIQRKLNVTLTNMEDKLKLTLTTSIKEQLSEGFKNHEDSFMQAVYSRAVTPSPHVNDPQVLLANVHQLLLKGHIEGAFQQALSAADLNLVVHVCEKVNPSEVFKPGHCLISQPVLLSLIQQLSADLGKNTELKLKYLEEAVLNLETTNVNTKEYMPTVLKELMQQLNSFSIKNPTHKCSRSMKMLLMAVQSLLRP